MVKSLQAAIWHCLNNYAFQDATFLAERLCAESKLKAIHTIDKCCSTLLLTDCVYFSSFHLHFFCARSILLHSQSNQMKAFLHWLLVIIDRIKFIKRFGCSTQRIPKLQNVDIYMQNVHST